MEGQQNSGINSFAMPKHFTELGEYAFNGAKLSRLVFNDAVTEVGDYAFADCGLSGHHCFIYYKYVKGIGDLALKKLHWEK